MIKRILEVSSPAYLHVKDLQLVIESLEDRERVLSVPMEDLGILILDNSGIRCSHNVFSLATKHNVAVVCCDEKHLPAGMFLNFSAHSLHAKILRQQIDLSEPRRKRVWQSIIRQKIEAQAQCLKLCRENDDNLAELSNRVRSGDPDNVEAQAARRYWPLLFSKNFKRDPDANGINSMLNYGYSVVRTSVCRALVGSGLSPALGIHHQNQYNAYALADDIMEPLRPLIDKKVYELSVKNSVSELNKQTKQHLLTLVTENFQVNGLQFPFFIALTHYTGSLAQYMAGEREELEYLTT
jgi:CRISPR-associated protein Cas1